MPTSKVRHRDVMRGNRLSVEEHFTLSESMIERLRMSDYLVQRVLSNRKITLHVQTEIEEVVGTEALESVLLYDKLESKRRSLSVSDVFVMIGADPNTAWLGGQLELERSGFIRTGIHLEDSIGSSFSTSIPGVFAIGDVRSGSVKRVASAVGEGAAAIAEVHRYLEALKKSQQTSDSAQL
jgi:thioredoxin reductase (NADPH)